jgi:hypothetical protein
VHAPTTVTPPIQAHPDFPNGTRSRPYRSDDTAIVKKKGPVM